MTHELPRIVDSGVIPFSHFPTRAQCFVFRNWEIIKPSVLAEILGCDEHDVLQTAQDMGLAVPPTVDPQWLTKGYITIIRANWHLCSYEELAHMLGWSTEKLAFILKEDDFLDVKLGFTKPKLPPLRYETLNEKQKAATARIAEIVRAAREKMPQNAAKPFDFIPLFESAAKSSQTAKIENPRFENRIVSSYCSLYGDVFLDKALLDASFPDELLQAYHALGINGIWTQAVLYTVAPYPFEPKLSQGYQTRLEHMRYLIKKLAKYGIKLFLYINEPRCLSKAFFENHADIKGYTSSENDSACLCVSTPEVQEYLYNASKFLCENLPGLGGYITITASENLTNCYSRAYENNCNCPRCSKRKPAEIFADVNRFLYEGAASVNPDFTVTAWNWAWGNYGENANLDTVKNLPHGVNVMAVSEERVKKNVGGIETQVIDYSISVEGPGDYAKSTWEQAHKTAHKAYAKLQLGNTWEIAATTCIPAFEKIYRSLCRLCDCNIDGIMLGWTLGGFPSYNLRLAKAFYERKDSLPTLNEIYEEMFPAQNIPALAEAFHILSEAFDEFPFHINVAYNAPQHYGTSNLLYPEKTGYPASMVGYPYDALDDWRAIYPRDVFISQLKKLSDGWHRGTLALEKAIGKHNDDTALLLRCTRVIDCHFRSMYNQSIFVDRRDRGEIDTVVASDEMRLAEEMLTHVSLDPTVGYEASNHYFFTKNTLLEKLINCDCIIRTYKK